MIAKSTSICLHLLDQVTTYVIIPRRPQGFPTEPEKSFVLLYRMLYVLGCLQRDQESAITDWEWGKATSEEGEAPNIDNVIFGSILHCRGRSGKVECNF
ncbi:hypothetical protein BKA61DRAFT_594531 [Leptodontidium sp. MPI-SDFR-AT-0119]|nr:hypothetical protein BKA61DRAFT_594531 [Leptodontidium sp. MPI-SDFR-AT-0119]